MSSNPVTQYIVLADREGMAWRSVFATLAHARGYVALLKLEGGWRGIRIIEGGES